MTPSDVRLKAQLDAALAPHGLSTRFVPSDEPELSDDEFEVLDAAGRPTGYQIQLSGRDLAPNKVLLDAAGNLQGVQYFISNLTPTPAEAVEMIVADMKAVA